MGGTGWLVRPENKGKWSVARGINIYHVGDVHQIVMKGGTTERRAVVNVFIRSTSLRFSLPLSLPSRYGGLAFSYCVAYTDRLVVYYVVVALNLARVTRKSMTR